MEPVRKQQKEYFIYLIGVLFTFLRDTVICLSFCPTFSQCSIPTYFTTKDKSWMEDRSLQKSIKQGWFTSGCWLKERGTIKDINTLLRFFLCDIQLGPYKLGHWHNFHHFGSVHHHNGLEMKHSRCALSADFQVLMRSSVGWCLILALHGHKNMC